MTYYKLFIKDSFFRVHLKGEFRKTTMDIYNCEWWEVFIWRAWSLTLNDYKWREK